ncbi:phage tail protein I [Brevibacillus panacihumi]|uniref:Phage tail protein I n=1 Tax=Brevibacillus panacihumi TaxID=497735 RepID=A0A3M8CBG2_9BACL|nr:phage tail protein I [Brevibacillus panacihumi]RNB72185.1 phage tail protein I [Brevibacillus panacihumi]
MIKLQDVSLKKDILPPALANDPDVSAMASALDPELQLITQQIRDTLILSRIDELPEEVIEHLLWQFHITLNEGAALADTLQEKRELVKNALEIHRMKGTKAALERVLELLNMQGTISEWFEYGGDPYHFRIDILDVSTRGITEDLIRQLDILIFAYKNTRSWLESIRIFLSGRGKVRVAGATLSGEKVTVYPWSETLLEGRGAIKFGAVYQTVESTTVYPGKGG